MLTLKKHFFTVTLTKKKKRRQTIELYCNNIFYTKYLRGYIDVRL